MKKILFILTNMLFVLKSFAAPVKIDVMFVYDTSAAEHLKEANIDQGDFAKRVLTEAQTAFLNSEIDVNLKYVHHMEINYAPPDTQRNPGRAQNSYGGGIGKDLAYLSENTEVKQARDLYKADLVQMIVDLDIDKSKSWSVTSGIAQQYYPSNSFDWQKDRGFSVVSIQDIGTGIPGTSSHEMGHNLGASHDYEHLGTYVDGTKVKPSYEYGLGYYYSKGGETYHTIMAYRDYTKSANESPYFSTPCKTDGGVAVGTEQENNTRAISHSIGAVSSYRGNDQRAFAVAKDTCNNLGNYSINTTISRSSGGNGTIKCDPSYVVTGSSVATTCRALPDDTSFHYQWGEKCSGTDAKADCTFTLEQNETVSAWFVKKPLITIGHNTGGTIVCSEGLPDDIITCEAIPLSGYLFDSWGDSCDGRGLSQTPNICKFRLGFQDAAISGNFKTASNTTPNKYAITVQTPTNGSLFCDSSTATIGQSIKCSAAPDNGYSIGAWGDACQNISSDSNICTFSLKDTSIVSITFKKLPAVVYDIATKTPNNGKLFCNSTNAVANQTVNCYAEPDSGYVVESWGGACSNIAPEKNICTFTVSGTTTVSASFKSDIVSTSAHQQTWLDSHNVYRQKHQVAKLAWSEALATSAQNFVNTCPSGHSNLGYGENMAFASYPQQPSAVVDRWHNEASNYNYQKPGYSNSTGHFTQIVWKGTTELGCAQIDTCPGTWKSIAVCLYNPPGNYSGQFSNNVFPPKENPFIFIDNFE